jgi:hypothetical protein
MTIEQTLGTHPAQNGETAGLDKLTSIAGQLNHAAAAVAAAHQWEMSLFVALVAAAAAAAAGMWLAGGGGGGGDSAGPGAKKRDGLLDADRKLRSTSTQKNPQAPRNLHVRHHRQTRGTRDKKSEGRAVGREPRSTHRYTNTPTHDTRNTPHRTRRTTTRHTTHQHKAESTRAAHADVPAA